MPPETNVVSHWAAIGFTSRARARLAGGVVLTENWTSPLTTPRLATVWTAMSSASVAVMPEGGATTLLVHPAHRDSASSARAAHARKVRVIACLLRGSVGKRPEGRSQPACHGRGPGTVRTYGGGAGRGVAEWRAPARNLTGEPRLLQLPAPPAGGPGLAEQRQDLAAEAGHQIVQRARGRIPGRRDRHDHHALARELEAVLERDRGERRLAHAQHHAHALLERHLGR